MYIQNIKITQKSISQKQGEKRIPPLLGITEFSNRQVKFKQNILKLSNFAACIQIHGYKGLSPDSSNNSNGSQVFVEMDTFIVRAKRSFH